MVDIDIELTIGALLHDIGKIIYREGSDNRAHSQSGYDYVKSLGIIEENSCILDCIKYHHAGPLRNAKIEDSSPAYIVYIADNIASSIDRRKKEIEEKGFSIHTPLHPVFNLLNGNNGNSYYSVNKNNMEKDINFPTDEKKSFSRELYSEIIANITDNLKGLEVSYEYVNSLLEVLEANLSYIPSATSNAEVPDISLYDHLKITAAISSCIKQYLNEKEDDNYKDTLFKKGDDFYLEKAFMLASLDISGIQNFIYTIQSEKALKSLRARSFYLEIIMEHIVDEILEKENLSRANLLYSGGGHCYFILPNTLKSREIFDNTVNKANTWFLKYFNTELYIAGGYSECSADDLKNIPSGSYAALFRNLSQRISDRKLKRYTASEIISLNTQQADDYSRECSVCKKMSHIDENGRCPVCASLEKLSGKILYEDFFSSRMQEDDKALPLPMGFSLVHDNLDSLKDRIKNDDYFVRAYSKNRSYTGKNVSTKIWVGNYTTGDSFEEFAQKSSGIKRVGILRADVDNLGTAFVSGFNNKDNDNRYVTISRTATLSRQLSLFFKLHINKILENPEFTFDGVKKEKRNITIVYSGGDDIFAVGAWNDIVEFAVDLRRAFDRYTEGTLSISAGIGLFEDSFPISVSASMVEAMVDQSKSNPGKNSITLLEDGETHSVLDSKTSDEIAISDGTYKWSEFEKEVVDEKFKTISGYMNKVKDQKGNSFLYRILELIRKREDKINFARFVYTLARMEPDPDSAQDIKESFSTFSSKMIAWIHNDKDCRHLKTAIELYVYLNREQEVQQ